MKTIKNQKSIDAVAMMREIRDKLSEDYIINPDDEDKKLVQIREKCNIKVN